MPIFFHELIIPHCSFTECLLSSLLLNCTKPIQFSAYWRSLLAFAVWIQVSPKFASVVHPWKWQKKNRREFKMAIRAFIRQRNIGFWNFLIQPTSLKIIMLTWLQNLHFVKFRLRDLGSEVSFPVPTPRQPFDARRLPCLLSERVLCFRKRSSVNFLASIYTLETIFLTLHNMNQTEDVYYTQMKRNCWVSPTWPIA